MLEKIKAKIESLQVRNATFDLGQFNDPLAETIDWNPLKGGGTNFRTHKLRVVDPFRMVFQATVGALIFSGIFAIAGLVIPGIILNQNLSNGVPVSSSENLFLIAFSLLFVGVGTGLAYFYSKPIIFDQQAGFFWKGRKTPQMYSNQNPKSAVRLDKIHSIQLIPERIKSDNGSYVSYELNLVLKDGSRVNVVDHGNLNSLRKDAIQLSKFLDKPLWDAL